MASRSASRKLRRKRRPSARRRILRRVGLAAAGAAVIAVLYGAFLAWSVTRQFEGRRWDLPAQVYAAPLELYAGRALNVEDLAAELDRLGFAEDPRLRSPGTYRVGLGRMEISTRGFSIEGDVEPARLVSIAFSGSRIAALRDSSGGSVAIVRLNPLLIGSLFPAHGEDRLILAPEEIPPLLGEALQAVEDRRFAQHHGIDLRAIARAAFVNVTSGEIRQGASTLTQQLVRSYFLTNERTWWRKLREAFMAIALEVRYDKTELLHAYMNEIYLGQDGARAVHGFGLASQFYFGKPLMELDLHELALLIAEVRGPAYYDPRRHPQRALERRNLVLQQLVDRELVDADEADAARTRGLDLIPRTTRSATQSAFLSLVRRQLSADYDAEDLEQTGLVVYSTLDPAMQGVAERALTSGLEALGENAADFDGAVLITSPQTGEVRALVGGRNLRLEGFNRALDARRQIGSLIKPAVYLAALESGEYSLASMIDDEPIEVPLPNGDIWAPRNFDDQAHGPVPLVRALAESLNMATVRLGLQVGLEPIAELMQRLGLADKPRLFPSLLLGSLELTPLEVTQLYNTLANGGFRVPLKAVRSVVAEGAVLQRYPIELTQAADADAVYALNQALVQVMERGTGRSVRAQLPGDVTIAGKTGTSDDLRDSWFAGFTNDHLVVTWLGADDNRPTGLTGSTGAGRIAARAIAQLEVSSYSPPLPDSLRVRHVDYLTGAPTGARCAGAVAVPLPAGDRVPRAFGCSGSESIGSKVLRWLDSED
jgi:penicillin-binding protein 1B